MTGSLNAGLAQWLLSEGVVAGNYTVQQGTVLGRGGLLTITASGNHLGWRGQPHRGQWHRGAVGTAGKRR